MRPKEFKPLTKLLLVLLTVGILVLAAFAFGVFGDTTLNLTLRTNAGLENGLISHWTFDGKDMTASDALDSVGSNNATVVTNPTASGGVLNIEGFEHGSTDLALLTSGTFSIQNSVVRTGGYALRINPTTTGTGFYQVGSSTDTGRHNNYAEVNNYTRFYFRVDTLPAGADEEIVHFRRAGNASKWALRIAYSGELVAYDDDDVTPVATSSSALSTGTWYRIEVFSDSGGGAGGNIEVRINGTEEINVSGIGTDGSVHGRVSFGKVVDNNGNTVDFYYDDILISNSGFPGAGQIEIMQVDGNGSNSGWSEGTNLSDFNEVDELPHDSGTTEIVTTASAATSTFNMESASSAGISGTINATRAIGITNDDGGTSNGLKIGVISGSTEDFSTGHDPAINYGEESSLRVFETDPSTSSAWTAGGLDDVEVGVAVGVNNNAFHASAIYMEVDFVPLASLVTQGRLGQALKLDGINDYADAGNIGSGIQTIAFWMKTATTSYNMEVINVDGTDQIELNGSSQVTATSFPAATVYVDGSSSSAVVATSTWHHVVITDTTGVTGTTFEIGAATTTGYFGGSLDDVRVYNHVLSQDEITRLYNLGATTHVGTTLGTVGSNPDLSNGLVGHWTFDGPDLLNNATDKSGQGNDGFLTNFTSTTTTFGPIGQALEFDGSDDYVSAGDVLDLGYQDPATISAWIYLDDASGIKTILSKEDADSPFDGWTFDINAQKLRYSYINNFSANYFQSDTDSNFAVSLNTWQHVAVVYTTNAVTFYVDGVVSADTDLKANANGNVDTTVELNIGGRDNDSAGGASDWSGSLDDVRIYNRALSADEITRLYNLGATTHVGKTLGTVGSNPDLSSGLVGHWTFDGPDLLNNATDKSGQGNDGFLTNFTSTTTTFGRLGQALKLDGINDYADAGNIGSGIQTIAFWMKTATTSYNMEVINVDGTDQIELNGSSQVTATSFPAATVYVDGSSSSAVVATSTWHHVVITDTTGVTGTTFEIGAATTTGYFGGSLDDVRVYNHVLSQDEITRLYNLGIGR